MYGQSRTLPQPLSIHITLSTPQSRITTRSFLLYLLYYIFYVRKGRRFGEFARGTFGGEIKAPPPQALLILIRYLIYCILFHLVQFKAMFILINTFVIMAWSIIIVLIIATLSALLLFSPIFSPNALAQSLHIFINM